MKDAQALGYYPLRFLLVNRPEAMDRMLDIAYRCIRAPDKEGRFLQ